MNLLKKANYLKYGMNIWPPLVGAGIKITHIANDFRQIDVRMKLRWYNRNYKFTHFGGSLYAMTDPFLMMMFMALLGKEYIVWDKGASIDFIKPGTGTVYASFILTQDDIDRAIKQTASGEKYLPEFSVDILNEKGDIVSHVTKTLYIRRKPAK